MENEKTLTKARKAHKPTRRPLRKTQWWEGDEKWAVTELLKSNGEIEYECDYIDPVTEQYVGVAIPIEEAKEILRTGKKTRKFDPNQQQIPGYTKVR